jgi:hypothetical protein
MTATSSPTLVREDTSSTRQQPRQRIRRHVLKPPPGDHEHLADGVICSHRIGPAARIRPHGRSVLGKQHP